MSTPAGWYDDGSGRQRWWDGQQWSEHVAPEAAPAASGYPASSVDAVSAYGAYPYGAYATAPTPSEQPKTPVLGYIGFGLAVLGLILACIPILFLFSTLTLLAAFVVSIIAVFLKDTRKWPSITGIVVSVFGGIVAVIAAFILALVNMANTGNHSAEALVSAVAPYLT